LLVRVPPLAVNETVKLSIGFPAGSTAAAESCQVLFPGPPFKGVPMITSDLTETTESVCAAEVPPPGEGDETVKWFKAGLAKLLAGTVMLSWVDETNVVGKMVSLKLTADCVPKFEPVRVIAVSGEPAASTEGEMVVSAGAGLLTVKLTELEAPPPGPGLLTTTA